MTEIPLLIAWTNVIYTRLGKSLDPCLKYNKTASTNAILSLVHRNLNEFVNIPLALDQNELFGAYFCENWVSKSN